MELIFDKNITACMISTFKNMSLLSYNSATSIEIEESLTVNGQKNVNTIKLCASQTNRFCNMLAFLMQPDVPDNDRLESFEIENLLSEIAACFSKTVASYLPVETECRISSKQPLSILVKKTKFELIILNILYCSLKSRSERKKAPLKILISATENKDSIVFRIKDNGNPLSPEIIEAAFSDLVNLPRDINDRSLATMVSLSIKVALKSAKQLNGSLEYKPLKSGNRFDITLPKAAPEATISFHSPVQYIPTPYCYDETFADISLEAILQKVVNNLEDLEIFKP